MTALPLQFRDGHLFVEVDRELWLIDTGAPSSFGNARSITIAGERFDLGTGYGSLGVEELARSVRVPCVGLLGADVLGRFDHVYDVPGGRLSLSTGELSSDGTTVRLDEVAGIPILTARIGDGEHRMFFDTGAQLSYFHGDRLAEFPCAGSFTDFHPSLGQFQTQTHQVPVSLGGEGFTLRCGSLPSALRASLMTAGTDGIVGNAILVHRTVGYFPRRRLMIL